MLTDGKRLDLAELLDGRSKRDLIRGMLTRSPHPQATEKLMLALEAYPLVYLLQAYEHPTRIWILDRGEVMSSAEILTSEMRARRWHANQISIDECEGLTDAASDYVAMVTSWYSLLVMRHEFAHVTTTFFSREEREGLTRLYLRARHHNHFIEPLARESIGEFVACALTCMFFPDLSDELARFDPSLHRFLTRIRDRAEERGQEISGAIRT